jgi:hypothetical protein
MIVAAAVVPMIVISGGSESGGAKPQPYFRSMGTKTG